MPSSVIRGYAYDSAAGSLDILFVTGRSYRYREVPAEVADKFRRAFSKGQFFNAEIRDRYRCERLGRGGPPPQLSSSTSQ